MLMLIYQDLLDKKAKLAVIGLGYVGLPLGLEFSKNIQVIGFDINTSLIDKLKEKYRSNNIYFTSDTDDLKQVGFFIIAVPTPVDMHKVPDLSYLKGATSLVGKVLKKGNYVVFESTVYPGCTEEDCIPILEQLSGLKAISDFKIGYSPERINPGDKSHTIVNTIKVVAGCDSISLNEIAKVYELVVKAGVHSAPTIKVAEAAKITENIQRDLNISLMNELSVIFDRMNIDTFEVIETAATKWNFSTYYPGLVGGHCIGIDPYYLTYKAQQLGYNSKVIAAGRFVNDDLPHYVSKKIVQYIIKNTGNIANKKVLVLGATFKENVSDIRNSKVADMVRDLLEYSLHVDFVDERADAAEVKHEYGLNLAAGINGKYDAIVLAVAHDEYKNLTEEYLLSITNPNALFADLKGLYRNKFLNLKYWSL